MERWRLVYLAKNLKAFYLPSTETFKSDLIFLKKRFRYRKIALVKEQMEFGLPPISEPLVMVDSEELGPLPVSIISESSISLNLSLASLFMVPILCSKIWLTKWEPLFSWCRRRQKPFSLPEFKFILRLLTYIPIDWAEKEEERIFAAIKEKQWASYLTSRRERLQQDAEKRFWRWPDEANGDIRLGLIDPLPYYVSFSLDLIPFSFPVGVLFIPD